MARRHAHGTRVASCQTADDIPIIRANCIKCDQGRLTPQTGHRNPRGGAKIKEVRGGQTLVGLSKVLYKTYLYLVVSI